MRRRNIFCAGLLVWSVLLVAPAFGQQADPLYPANPPTDVDDGDDVVVLPDVVVRPDVVARPAPQRTTGALPLTGGDILGLALLGVGVMAIGGALVAARRRVG